MIRLLQTFCPETERTEPGHAQGAQTWYLHPIFGVWTDERFCPEGIAFLCDYFQHSPNSRRLIPQFLVVNAFRMPDVFRHFQHPSFAITKPVPNASHLMILPGNQRIRCFDFCTRTIRTHLKTGFPPEALMGEIEIRSRLSTQFESVLPFLNISSDHTFWDEPLLHMIPLNRIPQRLIPGQIYEAIFKDFRRIAQTQANTIASYSYVEQLFMSIRDGFAELQKQWPGLNPKKLFHLMDLCAEHASKLDTIELGCSHGDFQPGNILVPPPFQSTIHGQPPFVLADWEDAAQRATIYDPLTFVLKARQPQGLTKRLVEYIEGRYLEHPALVQTFAISLQKSRRKSIAALFLMEEWVWLLQVSARAGISRMPAGLILHFQELNPQIAVFR